MLASALGAGVACAQTTDAPTTPAVEAPQVESSQAQAPDATQADGELTLNQSIAIALQNNGDTLAANRSFEAASQNVRAVRSDLYPQLDTSANYAYSAQSGVITSFDNTGTGGVQSTSSRSGRTTTSLNLSQNLFDSGRTKTLVRQAQASAVNAAGGVGNARNALAYEVAQRFYEQLRQARLVTQRQSQVSLAQSQLQLVQAQFEAGSVARSDIQSVQVNVSQAKLDLSTARNDLRVAQISFRNSLGLERGAALPLHDDLPSAALPTTVDVTATPIEVTVPDVAAPPLDPIENYLAQAERLRPELVQNRAQIENSQAAIKLAKIDASPQITASAGYALDPLNTGTRGFTFTTGVSIPIFDAGGRKASVKSAQNSLEASQITLDQTRKDVAADVEAAYIDIEGQTERLSNARALVEQASVNLNNATAKYKAGAGIILDIVNAQNQLFDAQNSYTGVLYDTQVSRLDLDRATGRFAWAAPDQDVPQNAPNTLQSATTALTALGAKSVMLPVAAPAVGG